MPWRAARAWTRDFEVCEVYQFGECGAESRDIRCGVEEGWVLFDKEILHFPAPVLWRLVFGRSLGCADLRLIYERLLGPCLWIDDWRQERVLGMWHMERESLYVSPYS
jgi:hypothetical protein